MSVDSVSGYFLQQHPQDAARIFEQFDPGAVSRYLEPLPPATVAHLFQYLSPSMVASCFASLDMEPAARILREMGIERASIYLRRVKRKRREKLLEALPSVYSGMLKLVLRYPDGSVGRYMDPDIITVNEHARVQNTVDFVRSNAKRLKNAIYVVDDRHKLAGIIDIKDLITADNNEPIMKIMSRPGHSIPARSRLNSVVTAIGDSHSSVYPVIDQNNNFIGVLRHETLIDISGRGGMTRSGEADLVGGLFIIAELFWKISLNLLVSGDDSRTKRGRDD
ncbi:MAG: CBS domain-containing protein [Gammaproteobacteria bacterium]